MILQTAPGVDWDGDGCRDTLWREVWQSGIVRFAVVHQDLRLPANTKVLIGALCRVWVGDEGDMGVCKRLCCFAVTKSDCT